MGASCFLRPLGGSKNSVDDHIRRLPCSPSFLGSRCDRASAGGSEQRAKGGPNDRYSSENFGGYPGQLEMGSAPYAFVIHILSGRRNSLLPVRHCCIAGTSRSLCISFFLLICECVVVAELFWDREKFLAFPSSSLYRITSLRVFIFLPRSPVFSCNFFNPDIVVNLSFDLNIRCL